MSGVTIIAVGNPGSAKSIFLNALTGKKLFNSEMNEGKHMTYQLEEKKNGKGQFIVTNGLVDKEKREAAGKAISNRLRKDGDFKIIFFVDQESGENCSEDATTMKLVLDAAPEIGQNTMSNSIKFCALFLVTPWPSFKMRHFCHFQGPTGLEATGGPGGPSQPLQSIKID